MKLIIAALSTLVLASAPAMAGQVGSQSTNSYYRETGSGTRTGQFSSHSQEQISGYTVSTSAKAEYTVPAGQTGATQWNMGAFANSQGAQASCNASNGQDPACLASSVKTVTTFSKQSGNSSSGTENSHFSFEQYTHTAGSSASF